MCAEERRASQQLNTAIRTQLVAASIGDDRHNQGDVR